MVVPLPTRPRLEQLKTQARELLLAVRAADPDSQARFRRFFPEEIAPRLSQAQLVIAREYGFPRWSRLKAHVESLALDTAGLIETAHQIVRAAVPRGDLETVRALLKQEHRVEPPTLSLACVTGNRDAVQRFLETTEAGAAIPPLDWEPLLYVCWSCLLRDPAYLPGLLETARFLLSRGADPNAFWKDGDWRESCLYGATGVNDCPELARLLLEAGANPNDGESMYHSAELPTPDCLWLLLEHGGEVGHGNALAHLLDREEPEWVRKFLSYAPDPSRIPASVLFHALRRGRDLETFRVLIASGMERNARSDNGLTLYQTGTRQGRTDITDLLITFGADTTLTAIDTLLGRAARGEPVAPQEISPEAIRALDSEPTPELLQMAEVGNNAILETLLRAGANPNVRDANGNVPLHYPAMHGSQETVRLLLRYQADPTLRDKVHNAHAVGWACYGSEQVRQAAPEVYVRIVEDLLDAGGILPETAWGSPQVQAALVQRGAAPAT